LGVSSATHPSLYNLKRRCFGTGPGLPLPFACPPDHFWLFRTFHAFFNLQLKPPHFYDFRALFPAPPTRLRENAHEGERRPTLSPHRKPRPLPLAGIALSTRLFKPVLSRDVPFSRGPFLLSGHPQAGQVPVFPKPCVCFFYGPSTVALVFSVLF